MKKKLLGIILALCMLLSLCACGGGNSESTPGAPASTPEAAEPAESGEPAAPAEEGAPEEAESTLPSTLTVGTTSKVTLSFDGADEANTFGFALCMDMVVYVDTDGQVKSHILDSWDLTDEGVTMTLKEGVTFTDGRPCTASDILWTYTDAISRGAGASDWETYYDFDNAEVSEDGLTLFIPTYEPYAPGISGLTQASPYVKSQSYFEEHPVEDEIWWDTVEGTGPYECVEQVDGAYATYRLRDNYWGDEEFVYEEITFNYYSDQNAMAIELQNGAVDCILDTSSFYVNEFSNDPEYIVKLHGEGNIINLAVNTKLVPEFNNELVREAIGLALNADEAGVIGADGLYEVSASIMPENCFGYIDAGSYMNGSDEDIERAKELMAEAGYPDGFTVTLTVRDNAEAVGEYVQGALSKIGINCQFECLEFMNFIMADRSGEIAITLGEWQTDNYGEPSLVYSKMNKDANSALGVIYDDEFYDLCIKCTGTIDEAERAELTAEIQHYVIDNNWVFPLYEKQKGWVYRAGTLPDDFECYWGNIPGGFRLAK